MLHSKWNRLLVLILLGLILAALAAAIIPRWRQRAELSAAVQRTRTESHAVKVVYPRQVIDAGVLLPGSTLAIEQTAVNARSNGFVAAWLVDVGTPVKAGQLMAKVAAPDVDTQAAQARDQRVQAAATWYQAVATARQLAAVVYQATAQRDAAVATLQQSQGTERSYEQKVLEARRQLEQDQSTTKADRAQLVFAQRELKRYRDLAVQGFTTWEQADQYQATYESAVARVAADQYAEQVARATINDNRASRDAAQAAVLAAAANVTAAQQNHRATQASLQAGQDAVRADEAALAAARENERHYGALQSFERVVAPFDGVVTARNIDVGSLINIPANNVTDTSPSSTAPITGMFGVARLDPLEVDVQAPQTYATSVAANDTAQVMVRELPNEHFPALVYAVAGALDAVSRTLQVKVRVRNPQGRLRPGMYAEVRLRFVNSRATIHLPATTLIFDARGTLVLVVTPQDRIHVQPVTVGRDFGGEIEILGGLRGNETIVNSPTDDLIEGMVVHPVIR